MSILVIMCGLLYILVLYVCTTIYYLYGISLPSYVSYLSTIVVCASIPLEFFIFLISDSSYDFVHFKVPIGVTLCVPIRVTVSVTVVVPVCVPV